MGVLMGILSAESKIHQFSRITCATQGSHMCHYLDTDSDSKKPLNTESEAFISPYTSKQTPEPLDMPAYCQIFAISFNLLEYFK